MRCNGKFTVCVACVVLLLLTSCFSDLVVFEKPRPNDIDIDIKPEREDMSAHTVLKPLKKHSASASTYIDRTSGLVVCVLPRLEDLAEPSMCSFPSRLGRHASRMGNRDAATSERSAVDKSELLPCVQLGRRRQVDQ